MRRFVFVGAVVVAVLCDPVAADGAQHYRAGQNVTLFVMKAGQPGDDDVMLPDECASVTVELKAPKASVGKKSGAFVTTEAGRVLHAFGKITRTTSSWKFRPSGVGGHENLPVGGHRNAPLVAAVSPHAWPFFLPTVLS